MSIPERPRPNQAFEFTEQEKLYDRITDERMQAILKDEQTTVHQLGLSTNSYGEFLFVTVSRPTESGRAVLTLWGLGYHEHRERWYTEQWSWYESNLQPTNEDDPISKEDAELLLQERREEIAAYASRPVQSERGRLFEMIADLTDDDGAISEMEDLENLFGTGLFDEE